MAHLPLLLLLLVLGPATALAHGVGARIVDANAVTLSANYSSGEPMAFAQVLVFRPGDDELEFARGRTDAQGNFAFVPNAPGTWTVAMDDGMGHALTKAISWDGAPMAPSALATAPAASSTLLKAVAGASLLLNGFFALALYLRR